MSQYLVYLKEQSRDTHQEFFALGGSSAAMKFLQKQDWPITPGSTTKIVVVVEKPSAGKITEYTFEGVPVMSWKKASTNVTKGAGAASGPDYDAPDEGSDDEDGEE